MAIESIRLYFEDDLQRLEALFNGFVRFKRTNFVAARECFRQFAQALRRRIVWEEEIVFPVFERALGAAGATRPFQLEHQEIGETLASIDERLDEGDACTVDLEAHLRAVLSSHDEKEETTLYPTVELALTAADLDRFSRAVTGFEVERNSRSYL
jgi:iron-sulfur cluster repair protein YtfE (RIC family)